MNGDDRYVSERQNLLTRLLDAVKQCQVRFGGRTELATDGDSRISCLCAAWEAALQHGMKHTNKALSTLKQVTAITGLTKVTGIGILDDIKNMETEPVFWHFVKEHLGKHELPRFQILKTINTDAGRGRAWLRSTLNEHSLEKYMHALLEHQPLLNQYYEDWAFVRDQERSSMLPMMAAGLGSILFAINIDNEELNTIKAASGLESLMPAGQPTAKAFAPRVEEEPRPVIAGEGSPTHSQEKKKERKRRKKVVNIVSFDEDEPSSYSTSPSSSVTSPQSITSGIDLGSILPAVASSEPPSTVTSPYDSTPALDTVQTVVSSNANLAANFEPNEKVEETLAGDTVAEVESRERAGTISGEQDLNTVSEGFAQLLATYPTAAAPMDLTGVISVPSGGNEQNPESASLKSQQSTDSGDSKSDAFMSDSGISKLHQPERNHVRESSKNVPVRRVHSLINMPRCSSDTSATSMEIEASIYSVEPNGPAETLTPLTPDGKPIGGMMVPIYPATNGDYGSGIYGTSVDSRDSSEMPLSFGADTENAAFALSMAQKGLVDSQGLRTQGDGSYTPEPVSFKHDSMSTEELKQAVVAMMLRKDEVEEQNKSLRALLDSEQEATTALRVEIEALKKENTVRQEKDADRMRALTRENELLKHQLKKYVNAVQVLRRKNNADVEDLHGIHLDEIQPAIPPNKPTVDYSLEASEYERKLIQVAEMHGELMEFNEMLHRQLNSREIQLQRLRQELVDLRGPLPGDVQSSDSSASVSSDFDSYGSSRPLINVWIPSAFLRGTSSDAYHVYQIYVRIRDEEWNVYRRYAEFYVLHSKLKKKNPIVSTFEFPPKKSFGNRNPKFVEERRKMLQIYIRRVLNLLVLNHPDLASCASRERLLEAMPFFGDQPVPDRKSKGKGKGGRRRSTGANSGGNTSSSPPQNSEVYMGL